MVRGVSETKMRISMETKRYFNLFEPQRFSSLAEDEAIRNNMTIDYFFGHRGNLREFVERKPEFGDHLQQLSKVSCRSMQDEVQRAKSRSVLMTVLMLTGRCNANCAICYSNRKLKPNELAFAEIKSIIDQTHELGSRLIYIPGEGEPTLDPSFWRTLEYAKSKGMRVILFTNGILLSNDIEAENEWGMSSEEVVRKLRDYPVYIYHKLWSTDPALVVEMMRINENIYNYTTISVRGEQITVPKGIALLLRLFPKHRVGIEAVVEKRNIKELLKTIVPFVSASGIKSYIEPIIHAGRCFGVFDFDPQMSKDEYRSLSPWLSRRNCRRVGYKLNVHNNGYLSFGMALAPEQIVAAPEVERLNIRDYDGSLKNLYNLIHTDPCLVSGRYKIDGCICEKLNLRLARNVGVNGIIQDACKTPFERHNRRQHLCTSCSGI